MIDSARLKRLLLMAAVLFFIASGAARLAGSPPLAGGLALGFVLGALPFASWAWVASLVVGYLLGSTLDRKLGTSPWLTVVGVLLGTAAGFVGLFRTVSRNLK